VAAIVAPQAVKIEAVNYLAMWRKVGVFMRIAREQAARNRTLNAMFKAAGATARSFGRIARQLWLEVTGTVFLAMAAFGAIALTREYMKFHTGHATAGRIVIAVCFTATFAWFGLSSFLRVRRKN
jgi:hypothetical protein